MFKNNRILDVINEAMKYFNNIWVGTEGVENIVKNIIEEHNFIAYYLYRQKCNINSKKAVYIPFASKVDKEVLSSIEGYLNRRKDYNGNWMKYILSLKDLKNKEILNEIKENDIIVGYPVIPTKDEIVNFIKFFK